MPLKTKKTNFSLRDDVLVEWLNVVAGMFENPDYPKRGKGSKTPKTTEDPSEILARLWEKTRVSDIGECKTGLQFLVCVHDLDIEETQVVLSLLFERLAMTAGMRTDVSVSRLFQADDVATSLLKVYEKTGPRSKLVKKGVIERRGLLGSDVILAPQALRYFGLDDKRRRTANELMKTRRKTNEALIETTKPRVRLNDVILPAATRETLEDALHFVRNRDAILSDAGLGNRIEKGKGVALLFFGPPGTGKTMTAEAVANELNKPFTVVRPEKLESCYFGETEKRIVRLFEESEKNKHLLIFDECDSYFSTRPRGEAYQNTIVSRCVNLMLRGIEEGTQVYILTTNRPEYLDPALERRLAEKIEFGLPDEAARRELWLRYLPANHSLTPQDIESLAVRYRLTGGVIKQVALSALRSTVREGRPVTRIDVMEALKGYRNKDARIGF